MPTYTYRCQKCGHEFERFQSMSDEPVKRCEKCKSKVQRVFHPVGIVLKGSGFYKTDNRSSSKKSSSSSGESKSSESTSSESKTETKSETKSDSKGDSKSSTKTSGSKSSSDG
jgi:putative FmdB family regulatory protein